MTDTPDLGTELTRQYPQARETLQQIIAALHQKCFSIDEPRLLMRMQSSVDSMICEAIAKHDLPEGFRAVIEDRESVFHMSFHVPTLIQRITICPTVLRDDPSIYFKRLKGAVLAQFGDEKFAHFVSARAAAMIRQGKFASLYIHGVWVTSDVTFKNSDYGNARARSRHWFQDHFEFNGERVQIGISYGD